MEGMALTTGIEPRTFRPKTQKLGARRSTSYSVSVPVFLSGSPRLICPFQSMPPVRR